MSNVHVVLFNDQRGAESMLENVTTWVDKGWLQVEDAVVVSRGVGSEGPPTSMVASANGERPVMLPGATGSSDIEIKQTTKQTGRFALGGGGVGLIAGMLLGGPIGGLIAGATLGAITGALRDTGIEDSFVKDVAAGLEPGTSALFLMTNGGDEAKILEELRPHKARLLKTSLSAERERALRDALS